MANDVMLTLQFTSTCSGATHLAGSMLGKKHLKEQLRRIVALAETRQHGDIVLLDFDGVQAATASYLKATALTLLNAAQRSADDGGRTSDRYADEIPVLPVFPMVINLCPEVREEFREVLKSQEMLLMEALKWKDGQVLKARLLGAPDRAVLETLADLQAAGEATATSLFETKKNRGVTTITAFNNRLADLFRRRLARRSRLGKQWIYSPVAKEVEHG